MKTFEVTVEKGDQTESMKIEAINSDEAKKSVVDVYYYDGWHATNVKEL